MSASSASSPAPTKAAKAAKSALEMAAGSAKAAKPEKVLLGPADVVANGATVGTVVIVERPRRKGPASIVPVQRDANGAPVQFDVLGVLAAATLLT